MFSWKCSMVQFLCVCILLREKSSSHVGGSWFWLLKKSSMIVVFLRWKLPHVFWTFGERIFFELFWIYFGSKIKNTLSWFFLIADSKILPCLHFFPKKLLFFIIIFFAIVSQQQRWRCSKGSWMTAKVFFESR